GGLGRVFLQAALWADMHGRVSAVEWDLLDLVELTRPHTGRERCPEVPRTTARVLAEDPEMVRPQSVAPRVVRRLLFGLAVSESAGGGGVWFDGTNLRPRNGANGRTGVPFQVV
ncbi:hypothetical protein TcG_04035, partial [Trypanosoma cruzi]